jgi:hypothetical protein
MSYNAALDIAIGLVLMYLVLSLMGTVVNEYISTICKLRATTLRDALKQVLDNRVLHADFYNHGLIASANAATGDHVSYLSGQTFASALLGSLDPTKALPDFAQIKSAVQNMPDCNIRDVLLAHITLANNDLTTLRDGLATYFDGAMDRVTGIYKRYLKWISFGVGLFLVVALNADTIAAATALWKDSSLRSQMVENARALVDQKNKPPPDAKQGGAGASDPQKKDASSPLDLDPDQLAKKLDDLETNIRPLPIGWPDQDMKKRLRSAHGCSAAFLYLMKILGLLMSALAVSLGAPFWFDTLSKFMNVRGAGAKPKEQKTAGGTSVGGGKT